MSPETLLVDVAGRKTEVVRGGSGPPLVYLHSAMGETWWFDGLDELAQSRTVLLPAHPGFGESEGLETIDDVEDMAFHMDDLFVSLALERPALVGSSLGGWLAAEYAVRWPDRVSALVLIDSAGLRVDGAPVVDMWATRPPELADLLFVDTSQPLYSLLKSFQPDHPPPAELLVPFLKAQQATARLGWNPYLHDPKLPARLHRVACPALVVWGERDGLIPPAHADAWARLLPDARTVTIADCGHLPMLERPAETVGAIGSFLASF